jgi:hypothetical protein
VKTTKRPEPLGTQGQLFSKPRASTRIVGGTTANSSEFPGLVGIRDYFQTWNPDTQEYDFWVSTCTGTAISATKILTAAHCTTDDPNGDIQVIAGRNDLDDTTTGTVYAVSNVWTHQGYNIGAQYDGTATAPLDDVAVLTLKKALNPVYTPYALTGQGDQSPYAEGTDAVIAGYGITEDTDTALAGVLHKATIKMQSNATCSSTASADGDSYDALRMTCAGIAPTTTGGTDGVDTCHGDSGGPLFVNGVEAGITDWGTSAGCASSYGFYERLSYYNTPVTADVNRANLPVNLDFSGDGHSDLLFRDGAGNIGQISGAGLMINSTAYGNFGGISDVFDYTNLTGFSTYKKVFRVTNWNGDGTESIFAMKTNGTLWQYTSNGHGTLNTTPKQIGTGWTMYTDIMVTNNWTGDGHPNLMGRKSTGELYIYTADGNGGWLNSHGIKIGVGWNAFNTILTPGNWRGKGQSLIARTTTGVLKLYESNGHGGWIDSHGTQIGVGWNTLPVFLSPGDWNGDNLVDLIGVSATGVMKLYPTDGTGKWLASHGIVMDGSSYYWPASYFKGLYLF